MRDNPSAWDGDELAAEGEDTLAWLDAEFDGLRDNPRKRKKKDIDEGMATVIAAAQSGTAADQKQVVEHYQKYLLETVGALFKRGLLWDRADKPQQKQKTLGKWLQADLEEIVQQTWLVLFSGSPILDKDRKRKRAHRPAIEKWNADRSKFSTFLVGVAKRVAQDYYRRKAKAWKGEQIAEQFTGGVGATVDLVEEFDPETEKLGKQQSKVLFAALSQLPEEPRRVMEARLGRDRPEEEKQDLKAQGKQYTRSYREMKQYLGLKSIGSVMSKLYRAREQLEQLTGLPMRGLVGVAREQFGKSTRGHSGAKDLVPAMTPTMAELEQQLVALTPKRTVVRRKNPAEIWIYFETEDDLVDLLEEGYLDEDMFDQCREALYAMGW